MDDYKFILRSIENYKSSTTNQKVLRVFKINPFDKTEEDKLKGEYLLFNGIKSDKVNNILNCGYPLRKFYDVNQISEAFHKMAQKNVIKVGSLDHSDTYNATTCLKDEISKGSSYCEVDKVVKQLSFVFVVSTENTSENHFVDKEVHTDSRGSCIDVDVKSKLVKRCVVPAYLIVFETKNENS